MTELLIMESTELLGAYNTEDQAEQFSSAFLLLRGVTRYAKP